MCSSIWTMSNFKLSNFCAYLGTFYVCLNVSLKRDDKYKSEKTFFSFWNNESSTNK